MRSVNVYTPLVCTHHTEAQHLRSLHGVLWLLAIVHGEQCRWLAFFRVNSLDPSCSNEFRITAVLKLSLRLSSIRARRNIECMRYVNMILSLQSGRSSFSVYSF